MQCRQWRKIQGSREQPKNRVQGTGDGACASFLIQSGVDLYPVKEILGHGSIALTERYSHLADSALKEAANKIPVLTTGDQAKKMVKLKKKS